MSIRTPREWACGLLAFNVGVEVGMFLALGLILVVITGWRATPAFARQAYSANVLSMTAGFARVGVQIAGFTLA